MASDSGSDLRIVLIGKNGSENSRVGNTLLGTEVFDSGAGSYSQQHSVRISGAVEERHITVINTPLLLQKNLLHHWIIERVRECVSMSAPGPHVIILVLQYNDFNENNRHRVKYLLNLFSEQAMKHTIVLTTDEEPHGFMSYMNTNNAIHDLIKECGGGHLKFDTVNTRWRSELIRRTEELLKKEHEEFLLCNMYEDGGDGSSVDEDPSRSGASDRGEDKEKKDSDHTESTKTASDGGDPEGVTLNLLVCGSNRELKSFISNLILKQSERRSELISECVRRDVELDGRLISLVELPALFNTQLSEEEVMRQTHRCVSLCHPGVHVFILIIPDAPLNNEDRAEIEEIQKIFSSRVNKHIMILIKQNSEHQTEELNGETKSVIERFGGRHNFIGLNTQVSELMEKLEQMVEENSGVCFSTETLMEAQMEKLQKLEEMKKRIHSLETWFQSQDSREREDDLRIVLLGKTGAGKSSTGNTILGRKAFISDMSEESVTKDCQKEKAEIDGRHITVIDTPGLFDTEFSNEESQRKISNCISMILPGPHVFLLLIPLGRFTQEEKTAVKIIQETFGENSLKYTMVFFTRGDDLNDKTIEQFLGKPRSALNELIKACGNRFHVFNNKETRDRTQVTDLLQKIDNMVKENGDSYYSCKMFREMEREIQEQQKKILMEKVEQVNREKEELMKKHGEEIKRMKMKMEEEQQNHEKERKRKEEEFLEREERYKRDIKEREEQEIKMREEQKREREEWMKQTQQERQKREEEEEKWRKREQEMWKENNQRLKQEEERMKMKMEEEQQNHEKERKIREVKFKESEELYKRKIKEREEQERKMLEEQKREREEWMKQTQQERQRREEEEEKWRKREQEMWNENNQRLKQEEERMNMKMEEEQQNHDQLRKRREDEEERMKMMMEKERQKHDKERKRREEEFREREEQYKRDIKEREEQKRKMREEQNREREEWEKQKQQERQKRDEEDEKWRRRQQEMWDENNQRLKQEIMNMKMEEERKNRDQLRKRREEEEERMKMMMEKERQKHEKERKRREEQYKIDIKETEEQERKIRQELKRERDEWEKQKQQERQKEEEEKERCRFNKLHKGTPEAQHTNNDEDSASDAGCLRILLFGRTGSGKSSTRNTILRNCVFHSEASTCTKVTGEVDGRSVAVIDTPGLFDPSLTEEQVQEEIMKCVSLSVPGPHVFIIVLSLGKFTPEEKETLDMIKMIFGLKAADFCIVLFTRGDKLKTQTIEQYVEKSKDAELKKLISDCGNRFRVFNNRETQDQTQVTHLFNMIEEMKRSNQDQYFTNEMFEEAAISIEQRMEKIEENERKNQAQIEELTAKYDEEKQTMKKRLVEKNQKIDEERERLKKKFREQEETLRREFEEKEESDQKKQETEDQRRSEEEDKQQRDEYKQRKEEFEEQRIQYEEELKEREEEERKKEEKYKKYQEKMKNDHEQIMTELRKEQEEEIKKRNSEKQMKNKQEVKEREEWKRKIKEAENNKDTQEKIKQLIREWEDKKKRQMREREEEERQRKEKHEKQLREKQEELENKRKTFEREREKEKHMIEEDREKQKTEREQKKREYEEKINEIKRYYEQMDRERKEEWKRRKQEDEERQVEKRKRWEKMMEDLKREQEEEIKRREKEERERIDREERECNEIKQKQEEEIEKMKKKHQDETRKQREELSDFRKRKEQQVQEIKDRLEEFQKQLNEAKRLREELESKERELKDKDSELKSKEYELKGKVDELESKKKELKGKDYTVNKLEKELKDKQSCHVM